MKKKINDEPDLKYSVGIYSDGSWVICSANDDGSAGLQLDGSEHLEDLPIALQGYLGDKRAKAIRRLIIEMEDEPLKIKKRVNANLRRTW